MSHNKYNPGFALIHIGTFFQTVLRWSLWRTNARDFNHDSVTKTDSNACRTYNGFTLHALSDCVRYIRFNQLRRIRYLGKHYIVILLIVCKFNNYIILISVEHRCRCCMSAMVALEATRPQSAYQSQSLLPDCIHLSKYIRDGRADDS